MVLPKRYGSTPLFGTNMVFSLSQNDDDDDDDMFVCVVMGAM